MFGNSITGIEDDYSLFYFVVHHFIKVPFYVYAYNMSNLLVIALYQLYLEQKEEFIAQAFDFAVTVEGNIFLNDLKFIERFQM